MDKSRRGDADEALGIALGVPFIGAIVFLGLKSCVSKATSSGDSSAPDLFSYIQSMDTQYFVIWALVVNIIVSLIAGASAGIGAGSKDPHPDDEIIVAPILVGFVLSLVALPMTAGNLWAMVVTNIIVTHVVSACLQEALSLSLLGFGSGIVVFGINLCLNYFYFPSPELPPKRRVAPVQVKVKSNRNLLEEKYEQATRLLQKIARDEVALDEQIEELDRKDSTDRLKLDLLAKEKAQIGVLRARVKQVEGVCSVLMVKYDSTKRTLEREKQLGKISVEARNNMTRLEQEIKSFLIESKMINIQLDSM